MSVQPLEQRKFPHMPHSPGVLVTRPLAADANRAFERGLLAAGLTVISVPLIETSACSFPQPDWSGFDWIFFTSKNAVQALLHCSSDRRWQSSALACVGPATAQSLIDAGLSPHFVSPVYEATRAAQALGQAYSLRGQRIFWPCGNLADPGLTAALETQGAEVTRQVVYRTQLKKQLTPSERQALSEGPVDLVVFTSPSAVEAFEQVVLRAGLLSGESFALACLGPRTTQAAERLFGSVSVQPASYTLESLGIAICQYFARKDL